MHKTLAPLIFLSLSAPAAQLVSYCSVNSASVTNTTPVSLNLVCPQFNPALGALTSADFVNSGGWAVSGTATVRNDGSTVLGPFAPGWSGPLVAAIRITHGPLPGDTITLSSTIPAVGIGVLQPSETLTLSLSPFFAASGVLHGTPPGSSLIQGTGTFLMPVTFELRPSSAPTLLAFSGTVSTGASTSIFMVYNYTPVPEPATGLLATGILALAVWPFRRRRLQ